MNIEHATLFLDGEVRYSTAPLGFNYEVENSITLTVISYTPNQKAAAGSDITITVTDVNEEPVITNLPQIVSCVTQPCT